MDDSNPITTDFNLFHKGTDHLPLSEPVRLF
jgi:hypothetical protein